MQFFETALANRHKALDEAEVRARSQLVAHQQQQADYENIQAQADAFQRQYNVDLDRLALERRDFQAQLERERETHSCEIDPLRSNARGSGFPRGRPLRNQPSRQARLLPARPRPLVNSFAAHPPTRSSMPIESATSSFAAHPSIASTASSLAARFSDGAAPSAPPSPDFFDSSPDRVPGLARYSPARPFQAPFHADDVLPDSPLRLQSLRPPSQPPPTANPADSRGSKAAFATTPPPDKVVRDLHLPSDGAGAPQHWHQLEGDGDNELADKPNLRAYRDQGVSFLERQPALENPSSRAPYGPAWAPARVSTRPSMERISERSYEDDPRAALVAIVGDQPPPERQGRTPPPNNYFLS